MASLSPYSITLGATDYPVKYAGLLAYIEPYLTNLETFTFSGGNVGLGVTPSQWLAGGYMDFPGNGFIGNATAFSSNSFFSGLNASYYSGQWRYKASSLAATTFGQVNGAFQWFTAPSGTAGNAISFTQAMTLDASGNLGIGTTTVSAKLHVSGNVVYTIPVTFAGATGNAAWTTGYGSQAVNASILATHNIIGSAVYSVSDKRLKSNITPLPKNAGLDFVKAVDPVSFDWKADNSHDTGFIAQALMTKGYGHLVSAISDGAMEEVTHEDGNVSPAGARFVVRYDSIVPILHAAIRDQQALIEALMARVAALESN